jgi:mycoredoxin
MESSVANVVMYTSSWCSDCWRAKRFMRDRGVEFREVNIEKDATAENTVIAANKGRRKVPTFEVDGRFFACSPFDADQLASELGIPLNH